ncbi:alpha/beta hydrolase [Sphingomonas sp. LH128]|uniref:alpha/beta fold hydrolase n=1 Tax=Sphingomonas sp. LH128 TaxID=473781 RepID=UPI00027CC298|nr:alpha/beta fold hydrolase [Sphingomonas sp. LH128]EJU11941.1 alpha/beta hydrolase [Sphingomonas sp. LH128]
MSQKTNFAFLHGGGQGDWVWRDTIAALHLQEPDAVGTVLGLNVPGCGAKRQRRTDDLTIDDIARELIADIEDAGMRDVVIVGHSQAGQVIPFMAQMRPDLFRRLVYVTCSLPLPGQTVLEMIGAIPASTHGDTAAAGARLSQERYRALFCNDMPPTQADAFLAELGRDTWPARTYSATDWKFEIARPIPSTFVLCRTDPCLPMAWQETFAERLKTDRRVVIDAGHQAMVTRPQALAEILLIEAGANA